jgi:hypothetical protein
MFVAAPDQAELKICCPHQPVRFISACLSGDIGALQSLWPGAPKRFIFNGSELSEAMTFEFYGIHNGDSIIALPLDGRDSVYATAHWLHLTRDSENFNEALRYMLDPATAGEAARLRDVHLMRLERRPRAFARFSSRAVMVEPERPRSDSSTVLGLAPKSPSVDALPFEESDAVGIKD